MMNNDPKLTTPVIRGGFINLDAIKTPECKPRRNVELSEAWSIINDLITGMRIDDPKYPAARDWLNKNRKYQIVSQNDNTPAE